MKAVVVYEPIFVTTRLVAQAIALGIGRSVNVVVLPADQVNGLLVHDADLLVVGGSALLARATALGSARPDEVVSSRGPAVGPGALNRPGVRDWLGSLGHIAMSAAAFDTRIRGRAVFARRASKAISRDLAHHGMSVIVPPASFLVEETGRLAPNEAKRAEAWGANLGGVLGARRAAG
jgi:hypothetical protein